MEIILFSTDIASHHDIKLLAPDINALHGVYKWSVDIDDCDKVLRVEAITPVAKEIEFILLKHGFTCHRMLVTIEE